MDLSREDTAQLRVFCRSQGLEACGNRAEVEERIKNSVRLGARMAVHIPSLGTDRIARVIRLMRNCHFEVCYVDDCTTGVHSLFDPFILIDDSDREGGSTSDTSEDSSEGIQDVPELMGMLRGVRLEVLWQHRIGEDSVEVWWPATLLDRVHGEFDSDGRQLYNLQADAMPWLGFPDALVQLASFLSADCINTPYGSLQWRIKPAESQQRTAAAQTPAQGRNRPHTAAPQTPAHGGGQLGSASPQAAARTPARSLSRQESRRLCIICCDEQREAAFVPCGHRLSCMGCAGELRSRGECPVCRSEIKDILRVFDG